MRQLFGVMVVVLVALTLAVAAFALPGSGVTSSAPLGRSVTVGPYTGVGTGLLDRYRHRVTSAFTVDSKDVYKGRFTYSFRIVNGVVRGTGNGVYLAATWRLDGVHQGQSFGCDVPMSTTPFQVDVSGSATDESIKLRFRLVGAKETNDDYDCGANFTGYASDSPRLADSLELVQGDGITVSRVNPSIPPLTKLEVVGGNSNRRVDLHEWTFTIRAPGEPPPPPQPPPSGGGSTNAGGACTISGTSGNDNLVGTPGRDVICGLAGDDVIRGRGGNDSLRGDAGKDRLFAGPGNDTLEGGGGADTLLGETGKDLLLAKDGARDTVDGGPQRDWATRDRVDRVRNVEVTG